MHTQQLDNGIFNNYATEPEMYYAVYPSPEQQERYKFLGAMATLFISALILTAITVTAIS